MANLGIRNSWPTYRREKGDCVVEPHNLGGRPSGAAEKKKQRLEVATAIASQNREAKVKDKGGKPTSVKELDSLFVQLEMLQGTRDELLRHRVKSAMVDLARLRSKLSVKATVGTKPMVALKSKTKVAISSTTPSQEAMAVITRREVALFKARWASLLS